MYDMDYFIYKVHPYGIIQNVEPLPEKIQYLASEESVGQPEIESEYHRKNGRNE